jgi:hypothetical protein
MLMPIKQETNGDVPPANTIGEANAPTGPMGKKKAKELALHGGSEACIKALDILWAKKKEADAEELNKNERYAKTYNLDKDMLELEWKRLANEEIVLKNEQSRLDNEAKSLQLKRIVEERIMGMDISTMNLGQREYCINLQAQISARGMSNWTLISFSNFASTMNFNIVHLVL